MADAPVFSRDRFPHLVGKRVLLLFPHIINHGGALSYTLHLAEQLHDSGAHVALLTLRTTRGGVNLPAGIDVISLKGPLTSSLAYWLLYPHWQARLNKTILQWRPDLLVPQVFPSNWWGWLYKRSHRKTKLAWVCHEPSAFIHSSSWIHALKPWWKSLVARNLSPLLAKVDIALSQYSDRTIANSGFTAESVKRIYGYVPDAIARPGIDYCATDRQARPGKSAIMTVARLSKFKRVDFLIDVFAEIHRMRPELIFYIVGTGEEETILRKKVDRLGLESHVIFSGAVDDNALVELYNCSSLYLHGSIDEPFGMAPLEAIACGTPVVAHNSGGPREFITDECGRLIDSLDKMEWAEKIGIYLDVILADKDIRNRVKRSAELFDWRCTLLPAMEVLNDLLSD